MLKKSILALVIILLVAISIDRLLYFRKFNLILITIDTLRSDFLSSYNPNSVSTPHIDRIAQEGTLFRNAYCLIPITLPSHTSIMTSRAPHKASVFNNGDVFDGKLPTMAEILTKNGYTTGAFVSLGVLRDNFGLNRGFKTYNNTEFKKRWYGLAPEVNRLFIPWLKNNSKKPFFAWVHYSDPHEPYIEADAPPDTEVIINNQSFTKLCLGKKEHNAIKFVALPGQTEIKFQAIKTADPLSNRVLVDRIFMKSRKDVELILGKEWKSRRRPSGAAGNYFEDFALVHVENKNDKPVPVRLFFDGKVTQSIDVIRRNYAAEVKYVDNYIGNLWEELSKLGILGKTIVILTADHGEGLGEHKRVGHIYPLYSEITKVPLIVRYPGLGHKTKKNGLLVSHLDVMPTALDLLRVKTSTLMEGQSLRRNLSWSPVDYFFAKRFQRSSSFTSTYAPQGRIDSFSLIRGNFKMIITGSKDSGEKVEIYDLAKDPQERRNLAEASGSISKETATLRSALEEYRREAEETQSKHFQPELNEEQKEMLKDLGYINQ